MRTYLKKVEISVEKHVFIFLAFRFTKAASQKVSDIFHSASGTDILEIESGNGIPRGRETEVGQFGIAVHKRLEPTRAQRLINGACGLFERRVVQLV